MLQLDPNRRITAADALKHSYFHSQPLPCHPSELPKFDGDFHEYTVRKERSELKSNPKFEKKVSNQPHRAYPQYPSDKPKQWHKQYHMPAPNQDQHSIQKFANKSNIDSKYSGYKHSNGDQSAMVAESGQLSMTRANSNGPKPI